MEDLPRVLFYKRLQRAGASLKGLWGKEVKDVELVDEKCSSILHRSWYCRRTKNCSTFSEKPGAKHSYTCQHLLSTLAYQTQEPIQNHPDCSKLSSVQSLNESLNALIFTNASQKNALISMSSFPFHVDSTKETITAPFLTVPTSINSRAMRFHSPVKTPVESSTPRKSGVFKILTPDSAPVTADDDIDPVLECNIMEYVIKRTESLADFIQGESDERLGPGVSGEQYCPLRMSKGKMDRRKTPKVKDNWIKFYI